MAPERIRRWKAPKFCCRAPPLFCSKSPVSHFGERIHDGQYSLVSFLYAVLLLTVHPVPSQCKIGGHVAPSLRYGVGTTGTNCYCTEIVGSGQR